MCTFVCVLNNVHTCACIHRLLFVCACESWPPEPVQVAVKVTVARQSEWHGGNSEGGEWGDSDSLWACYYRRGLACFPQRDASYWSSMSTLHFSSVCWGCPRLSSPLHTRIHSQKHALAQTHTHTQACTHTHTNTIIITPHVVSLNTYSFSWISGVKWEYPVLSLLSTVQLFLLCSRDPRKTIGF